jgi:hypothetical protein
MILEKPSTFFTWCKALEGRLYRIRSALHCLAFIPIRCAALHKSLPHHPQVVWGRRDFPLKNMLTMTFKCPCSTWTVDFQHLKNFKQLHRIFQIFNFFFLGLCFLCARECLVSSSGFVMHIMPFVPGLEAQG